MQKYQKLMRNQSSCKRNQEASEESAPFSFERIGNQEMINYLFGNRCEDKDNSNKEESLTEKLINSVEVASGVSMEDTSVHFNSDRPEKIGALAYTQGRHIYVGKGQEKYLPHEMWHVAQQKQGRVGTNETIGGFSANNDPKLEAEADSFSDSFQCGTTMRNFPNRKNSVVSSTVLQGKFTYSKEDFKERTETGKKEPGRLGKMFGAVTKRFKSTPSLDQLPQFSPEAIGSLKPFFVDMISVEETGIRTTEKVVRTKDAIFREFTEILANKKRVDFISWARENRQYLLLQYVEQLFDDDNLSEEIPVLGMVLDERLSKDYTAEELGLREGDFEQLETPSELMQIRQQTSGSIQESLSEGGKQDVTEENWRNANKTMLEKVQQPGIPDAQEFLNMLVILHKDVYKDGVPGFGTTREIARKVLAGIRGEFEKEKLSMILEMRTDDKYYPKGTDTYNEVKKGDISDDEKYKSSLDALPGVIRKLCSVTVINKDDNEPTEGQKIFLRSLLESPLTDEECKEYMQGGAFPLLPGAFVLKNLKQIFSWLSRELREIQTIEDPDKRLHKAISTATKLFVALISVHPFSDGNGRTFRLMADYVLMKYGYVPSAKIPSETLTFPKGGDSRVSDAPKKEKLLKFYEEIANGMQKSAALLHAKEEEK